jgi:hypothetical protein
MHPEAGQAAMRTCAYCTSLFAPRKGWATFCSPKCRTAYDVEVGATGKVASARKLARGRVSVIVWLEGPAADRAMKLSPGDLVRLVKAP